MDDFADWIVESFVDKVDWFVESSAICVFDWLVKCRVKDVVDWFVERIVDVVDRVAEESTSDRVAEESTGDVIDAFVEGLPSRVTDWLLSSSEDVVDWFVEDVDEVVDLFIEESAGDFIDDFVEGSASGVFDWLVLCSVEDFVDWFVEETVDDVFDRIVVGCPCDIVDSFVEGLGGVILFFELPLLLFGWLPRNNVWTVVDCEGTPDGCILTFDAPLFEEGCAPIPFDSLFWPALHPLSV